MLIRFNWFPRETPSSSSVAPHRNSVITIEFDSYRMVGATKSGCSPPGWPDGSSGVHNVNTCAVSQAGSNHISACGYDVVPCTDSLKAEFLGDGFHGSFL